MTKAKKIFYTVAASFAVGAMIGMLYAPNEGVETRRKIRRLKQKLHLAGEDETETDRDTLEELKSDLQKELNKINNRLEV